MQQITIAPLKDSDIAQVAPMLDYSWLMHAEKNDLYSIEEFSKANKATNWLKRMILNKDFGAFVAHFNKQAVGFIGFEIRDNPSYFTYKKQLFIVDVVVHKDHQGQGIATALEQQVEDEAKNLGLHMISGHVDTWNTSSQALMKKLGRTKGYEEWHKIV